MAKQKGIVKLKGSIGDLSFYKSKDGYIAREKGGIDKKRIATDPAFQRTRENGAEFGRAGKASKMLRQALRQYIQISSDSRVTSRLTAEMLRIIKTDNLNDRGLRVVSNGDLELLTGFDFNIGGKLSSTLFVPIQMNIDRAAGIANINIASFIPNKDIAFPSGSTHIRLISGLAEIDFDTEDVLFSGANSGEIVIGPQDSAPIDLAMNFTQNSSKELFLVLGVEFLQVVNGKEYPLKNGAFNALSIVAVSPADNVITPQLLGK